MAQTYQVTDALTLAKKLAKGVPFTSIDVSVADIINSTIYKFYPWRDTLKASGSGGWAEVNVTDSNQDFTTGLTDIYRVTQFWLTRTDTSPIQVRNLTVAKTIPIDLIKKSPYAIRQASFQASVNKFRLEAAVQISGNNSWTLGGEYQPHPTKITDLQEGFWFQDEHLEVFAKGFTYWAYRLADDSRAGSMQTVEGRPVYTGVLGEWMQAIMDMAGAEDFGNLMGYYPDESIGTVDGRRYYSSDIFPII